MSYNEFNHIYIKFIDKECKGVVFYISQMFIIVGYFIFFISRFRKEKKNILMTDSISRICFVVGYACAHSVNSIEHTLYGIIRNIVGQKLTIKARKIQIIGFVIMLSLLCVMYGISYAGYSTIMFIISGIINLYAAIFMKEQGIRIGTILAAICNIIAFSMIGSYASIAGELLCGTIGAISFVKSYMCRNMSK